MRKLTTTEIEQSPDRQLPSAHPFVVVVENVRSAFNVGSILRTADALQAQHVYLTGFSPPGDHRSVFKSALGAQDTVPWSHAADTASVLRMLKDDGYTLAALEITTSPTVAAALEANDYPLALLLGNEVDGVSMDSLATCDMALEIPQYGSKHSLNVAVAFGVMGYQIVERYRHFRD